ncbi:hypothetical protein CDAR_487881 [Caerostris darwini]|uniref:Uncharacterized protein n=1 Tax=Caerostris darwini TaxID=1538125 RepID=A0AAV4TW68_9ARAC|nr:hypothetical protein CDAR_487881 [Caerostris darwini]
MDDLLVQTIRPPSKIKPAMKDQALKQWFGQKGNRVLLEKGVVVAHPFPYWFTPTRWSVNSQKSVKSVKEVGRRGKKILLRRMSLGGQGLPEVDPVLYQCQRCISLTDEGY